MDFDFDTALVLTSLKNDPLKLTDQGFSEESKSSDCRASVAKRCSVVKGEIAGSTGIGPAHASSTAWRGRHRRGRS